MESLLAVGVFGYTVASKWEFFVPLVCQRASKPCKPMPVVVVVNVASRSSQHMVSPPVL